MFLPTKFLAPLCRATFALLILLAGTVDARPLSVVLFPATLPCRRR